MGSRLFSGCTTLTSITIPDGITNIRDHTFEDCRNLESITIPDSVISIDYAAFRDCSSLSSITIPEGVTSIGSCAFERCSKLTSINIPNSVTSIGESAFESCFRLTSINIPNSVTSIGYSAFSYCVKLNSITIPSSVTSIGKSAFKYCSSLTSINIPNSVTSIGEYAFYSCHNLTITCSNGSYAHTYAEENNIPYNLTYAEKVKDFSVTIDKSTYKSTGSAIKPEPKVVYNKKTLVKNKDYMVSYKDNTTIGTATLTVNLKGKYAGKKSVNFTIIDKDFPEGPEDGKSVMVIVHDSSGAFLEGCTYYYNDKEYKKGSSNCIINNVKSTDEIRIEKSGYIPQIIHSSPVKDMESVSVVLYKTSEKSIGDVTSAILQTNSLYADIAYENAVITLDPNNSDTLDGYFTLKFDTVLGQSTASEYKLCCNVNGKAKTIATNSTGNFNLAFGELVFSNDYYVIVKTGSNQTGVKTKLYLNVISFKTPEDAEFEFGDTISIPVPDWLPIIGGKNIETANLGKLPLRIKCDSNGNCQIGIGNDFLNDKKSLKENMDTVKSKVKYAELGVISTSDDNDHMKKNFLIFDNVSITVAGYGEGKINSNGIMFTNIVIAVSFSADGSIGEDLILCTIPCRLELDYGFSFSATADIGFDTATNKITSDSNLSLEAKISLTPFFGGGFRYANIGIYGNCIFSTKFCLLNKWQNQIGFQYVKFQGEIGVKSELGPFKNAFCVYKGDEFYIYNRNASTYAVQSMSPSPSYQDIFNLDCYDINPEQVGSTFDGDSEEGKVSTILSDVLHGSAPQIISSNDTTLMVFLDKDESRTAINANVLMYSVYDESTSSWTAPHKVDNNDTIDNRANLFSDGENIYLVYEEANCVLADDADIDAFSSSLEITTAKYNYATNSFEDFATLTDNDSYDSKPSVSIADGTLAATWVSNSDANHFGLNSTNSVMISQYIDNQWTIPVAVSENLNCITDINVGSVSNKAYVTYIVDEDNNLETAEDKLLYAVDINKTVTLISEGGIDRIQFTTLPEVEETTLTWYENGEIKYITDISDIPEYAVEGADYTVDSSYVIDKNKLYYVARTETGSELMLLTYDDGWSQPISVAKSKTNNYFEQLSVANDIAVMLNTNVGITSDDINTISDIVNYRFEEKTDLKVNGARYDYDYAVPNYQLPVYIDVTNVGTKTIRGVSVNVYNGDENVYSEEIDYLIRAGRNEEILILLDTDETVYTGEYMVEIVPLSDTDVTESNNSATFSINVSDLEMMVSELVTSDGGMVNVCVVNNSYVPATDSLITISDEEGNTLKTIDVPLVNANGMEAFFIPVNELLAEDVNEKFIYFTVSSDISEYDCLNNTAVESIVRITQAPESSIDECSVEINDSELVYTGSAITPDITVKDGETTLSAETDYTVSYSNNVNAGAATVTITGIGNYSGVVTKEFTIAKKSISSLTITIPDSSFTYTGSAITPTVTVKDGSKNLVAGINYTLAYGNNVNAGSNAVISITGNGNYTGNTTKTFTIAKKSAFLLTMSITSSSFTYTGKSFTPDVIVKDGSKTLLIGTDYTVSYSNNINTGTAIVTVIGIGNYSGAKSLSFTINPRNINTLSISDIEEKYIYRGTPILPSFVIKFGETKLSITKDYSLSYSDVLLIGKASVTITGIGNYTGTLTKEFEIVPKTPVVKTEFTSTTDAIRINWEEVEDATGYRIYRYNAQKKTWDSLTSIKDNTVLTYRDSDELASGTEYQYKVKAYKKVNDVNYWGFASVAITGVTTPNSVQFAMPNIATTSIRLFWNTVTCTGYRIQQYNSSTGIWSTISNVPYGTSELKISDLKSNVSYKYRIQAYTLASDNVAQKETSWSSVQTITTK